MDRGSDQGADPEEAAPLRRFCGAVAQDLRLFALLQDRELERDLVVDLRRDCGEGCLALRLEGDQGKEALELFRQGLADLPQTLSDQDLDILAVEYADIFLNNSFGASPCESVWIDDEGLAMQEPMFQIRDWYQRFGLQVENWRLRTDDHLVCQLQFIASLLERQGDEFDLGQAARFMDEHLLRWIADFAERVASRCRTRLYAGLIRLTSAYLSELRELMAQTLGEPIPTADEIDERMRPKVAVAVDPPGPYVPGTGPSW